jgi:hypothetical protein
VGRGQPGLGQERAGQFLILVLAGVDKAGVLAENFCARRTDWHFDRVDVRSG